ncbi:hypothetical protein TorRG33x02_300980 [Trema orientale]|uniref:Uncharacterized protein n=1 Tax=Trema orientale TaxID=63057 RepID=A0A2P5C1U3_TREOI|nr:hypothetical protein TorRG33x02_300980 [Trema orientale]
MSIITKPPPQPQIHNNKDAILSNAPKKLQLGKCKRKPNITKTINSHTHKLESKNPKILVSNSKLELDFILFSYQPKPRTKEWAKVTNKKIPSFFFLSLIKS